MGFHALILLHVKLFFIRPKVPHECEHESWGGGIGFVEHEGECFFSFNV